MGDESSHGDAAAISRVWNSVGDVPIVAGKGLPQIFIPGAWIQVLCALIIVFGIVRNLPSIHFICWHQAQLCPIKAAATGERRHEFVLHGLR